MSIYIDCIVPECREVWNGERKKSGRVSKLELSRLQSKFKLQEGNVEESFHVLQNV